jgi:nicotinate-nucleotide adenylyltransferase
LALLGLDQVWWLVSPQNPLKSRTGMVSLDRRLAMANLQARHPRILVTDIEVRLGTRFTFDTLAALARYYPRTEFVWLMGADNLGQIHRWQHWRGIFANIPIAVFDRPPHNLKTLASPAASAFARYRVDPAHSHALATTKPPAWTFFPSRLEPLSSTQLRHAARRFGPDSLRTRFVDPILAGLYLRNDGNAQGNPIEPQIDLSPTDRPVVKRAAARKQNAGDGQIPEQTANELSPEALRDAIVQSIDDDKGEDIVVVDLRGISAISDFIVIATGRSARQVSSMADHLVQKLQPKLSFRMAIEGLPQGDWVLIDAGDVIVHLFRPEVRDFYAIEKMWGLEPPPMAVMGTTSSPALNPP